MNNKIIVKLSILLISIISSNSFACSLADSFLRPSNYELVQSAETIVLTKFELISGSEEAEMRVIEVLKGEPNKEVLWKSLPSKRYQGASEPYNFSDARPGAYSGSCSAYDFAAGKYYIIMKPGGIFSRSDEEVENENAPWVSAVREYSLLSPSQLKERSKYLRNKNTLTKYEAALLADIDLHFRTPSYNKSIEELVDIWNSAWPAYIEDQKSELKPRGKNSDELETEYTRRYKNEYKVSGTLWALSELNDSKAKKIFQRVSNSNYFKNFAKQYSNYFESNPSSDSLTTLFQAYERINKLDIREYEKHETSWKLMYSIINVSKTVDPSKMLRLVELSSNGEEIARTIESLPSEYQNEAISIASSKIDFLKSNQDMLVKKLARMDDPSIFEWAKQSLYRDLKHSRLAMLALASLPEKTSQDVVNQILEDDKPEVVYYLSGLDATYDKNKEAKIIDIRKSKKNFSKWIEAKLISLETQGDRDIRRWLDVIEIYPVKKLEVSD